MTLSAYHADQRAARMLPWDKLGTIVEAPLSSADLPARTKLDWTLELAPLAAADTRPLPGGDSLTEYSAIPGFVATRRSDTKQVLGIVGKDWTPCQNAQMFDFLRGLAAGSDPQVETAGCVRGGRIVWLQVAMPELDLAIGQDRSKGLLLVSNGHAGNRMLTIQPSTHRFRCMNQLPMIDRLSRARHGLARGYRIRHDRGLEAGLKDAQEALLRARRAHGITREAYETLAAMPVTESMARAYFAQVFAQPHIDIDLSGLDETARARAIAEARTQQESERAQAIAQARENRLVEILESPTCTVEGTAGTAFAMLQAVVEYVDHERPTRTGGGDSEATSRFASAVFGSGLEVKDRAVDVLLNR